LPEVRILQLEHRQVKGKLMPCRSEEYKVVCALAELCGADVRHGPTGAEQAFGIFLPRAIIFAPD